MKELWSLAREASVAVGAYVGMVRDRFWAELSNGDGFDERVARAKAEFAADRLAKKEAQEEVSEPSLQERQPYSPFVRFHNSPACSSGHCVCEVAQEPSAPSVDAYTDTPARSSASDGWWLKDAAECRCPSCTDVLQAEQESSPVAAAQRTEEPPEVEPTPPVKAPSGGIKPEPALSHYELRTAAMGIDKLIPHELEINRTYWRLLSARMERLADGIEAQQ